MVQGSYISHAEGKPDEVLRQGDVVSGGKDRNHWIENVGSDGASCATCHFHAGADSRTKHQLSPGLKGGNGVFDLTASGTRGPNNEVTPADYPFHQLDDINDRNSAVLFDTDDVTSSAGVHPTKFLNVAAGGKEWDLEVELRVYRDASNKNDFIETLWRYLRSSA